MTTHTTFVVGFDGSEAAQDALRLGELLADVFDGALVVAVVHPFDRLMPHGGVTPVPPYDFEAASREQAHRVADQARALCRSTDIAEVRVIGAAVAADALASLGEELDAAAVVVGSSEHAAIGRIAPGSVAEALLSGAPCPVAVAPAGFAARAQRHLCRVGVAYDGSEESAHALGAAERLAAPVHARLSVVGVADAPDDDVSTAVRHAVAAAPAMLAAHADVRTGDPADALAEASSDLDLLVCGSRRRGPLRRVVLGSVTAKLIRSARCPVLVIPRGTAGPLRDTPAGAVGASGRS